MQWSANAHHEEILLTFDESWLAIPAAFVSTPNALTSCGSVPRSLTLTTSPKSAQRAEGTIVAVASSVGETTINSSSRITTGYLVSSGRVDSCLRTIHQFPSGVPAAAVPFLDCVTHWITVYRISR